MTEAFPFDCDISSQEDPEILQTPKGEAPRLGPSARALRAPALRYITSHLGGACILLARVQVGVASRSEVTGPKFLSYWGFLIGYKSSNSLIALRYRPVPLPLDRRDTVGYSSPSSGGLYLCTLCTTHLRRALRERKPNTTREAIMAERLKGVRRFSDLHAKTMRWFWYPYIPYGNTSIIFAPGGHGKSFLTAALATAHTNGDPLPGQPETRDPGKVLMLSAEDDTEVVLIPRLHGMGADLENIFDPSKPFELSEDGLVQLEKLIIETHATLVIIDPMVHYIGNKVDMNKMNEVRGIIGKIQQMAMKYPDTAIVLVHHSRKTRESDRGDMDFEKAAGSADFVNAVRSAMLIERSKEGDHNLLRHVKSNYAPLGKSVGFKFGGENLFEWGDFYDRDGKTAIIRPRRKPAREVAWDFILPYLVKGPQIGADLVILAAKEGILRKNVYRAAEGRVNPRYVKTKEGKTRVEWTLKPEYAPKEAPTPAETKEDKVQKAIARLNAQASEAK